MAAVQKTGEGYQLSLWHYVLTDEGRDTPEKLGPSCWRQGPYRAPQKLKEG